MHGRRRTQGFTLVELMVVVGIASILATTFSSVMYFQVLTFMERLDEADAHQTARGAFNAIRHSVQGARYGFGQDANAVGAVGVGQCARDDYSGTQSACTGVDPNNSDRLRLVSIINDQYFVGSSPFRSSGPCTTNSTALYSTYINLLAAPPNGAGVSTTYAIGGNCADSNFPAATDVVTIVSTGGGGATGCGYTARFRRLDNGSALLSCPSGYAKGFAYGMAQIRDYRVVQDATNPNNLNLVMRSSPYRRAPAAPVDLVLAYNITQFKVSYLIDYTTPADHRADNTLAPCSDPRSVADGGSCPNVDSLGNTLTTQQLYNRIVGLQITLNLRSPVPRKGLKGKNVVDDYRIWSYTSQFAVRNNGT